MTVDWVAFTPEAALSAWLGGCLIGLAAVWLALMNSRVAGVSGILGGLLDPIVQRQRSAVGWRVAFLLGLLAAPIFWQCFWPLPPIIEQTDSRGLLLGGLLVGLGARYANGCTSGHGICGLARFSRRSLVAVVVFMASAMLTVWIVGYGQ